MLGMLDVGGNQSRTYSGTTSRHPAAGTYSGKLLATSA
jgi:hypothetical protein